MNKKSVHNLIDSHILNHLRELDRPSKKHWPYQTEITWYQVKDIEDAERWCYTHFKSRNWRNIGGKFYFKRKENYEWFVLRWA